MSECIDLQQMTGSTKTGPLQPREVELLSNELIKSTDEVKRHQRQKMTPVPQQLEQPIQLTPVWEHVVRTQQFPPDVDTCSTFIEIISRLRDPEWEVRQHALRVLVDVLPTLDGDCVDELMEPVLIQLINNLGHLAPAVRKGALDALRVYMQCTRVRDDIVQNILNEGLKRQDVDDLFQTNIALGVILSTPSLLFPSTNSPNPSKQSVKSVIAALIACLGQVSNQEAAVRSLVKIRNIIGAEEFYSHFSDHDPSVKRDFDVLCQVYSLNQSPKYKKKMKRSGERKSAGDEKVDDEKLKSDDNSLEKRDEDKIDDNMKIPPSRVVLETEIKFNEETAITMTILEEKDEETDIDSADDNALKIEEVVEEERNRENSSETTDETKDDWIERRKTPRRVHFGGEIVKLRTPDSDDSEVTHVEIPQTRIPLPISPVTKMTINRPMRSRSNPSSPNLPRSKLPKRSRSVSNSPKREFYVHDGSLSPKKSILMKNNSSFVGKSFKKSLENSMDDLFGIRESDRSWSFEVFDDVNENILQEEMNLFIEKPRKKKKVKKITRMNSANSMKNAKLTEQIGVSNEVIKSAEESNEIHFVESPEVKVEALNTLAASPSNYVNACEQSVNENVSMPVKEEGEENLENVVITSNEGTIIAENKVEDVKASSIAEDVDDKRTKDKMRSSPRKLAFESFPRQERNYILMELSSPVKGNSRSREVSPRGIQSTENSLEFKTPPFTDPQPTELNAPAISNETLKLEKSSLTNVVTSKQMIKDKINEDVKTKSKNFIPKCVGAKNVENSDDNSSRTDDSVNGETKIDEPSWEELGLVDQDVLNDLHNKDDWRARVRGLERVASALRTSSALIAIEPRLGSLLHCVLGGERSCRVAAAGMAVARVVVAGVSEEALKRRLPQVAWGLSRQGGPNAAQLARIAMLRLRPALFLEQLLQPHCIDARNAKTRENALQLLIFSLVTFPSTEFKVENVANKVALMVGDRRRRVRQAALDTLAVLAQIYEAEEVLQAGRRAAKQLKESLDMVAAIRARLARKSLPMVSADGLVVYGLQISPTVQIATGPDVDWIVAGSGSVSPGTGRPRGQIISMDGKTENNKKNSKANNESKKSSTSATERNFVAVGVGLHPKMERPVAWQLVPPSSKGENHSVSYDVGKIYRNASPMNIGLSNRVNLRIDDSLPFTSPLEIIDDAYGTSAVNVSLLWNDRDVIMTQRKTEENFHKRMDEIYGDRSREIVKIESRIPIRQFHDHQMIVRHSTAYQRRRHPIEEGNHDMPSSAPHSSISELRDDEIQRRYRSDRIKQQSRPASNDQSGRISPKPIHEPYVSGYRHNRRKSVIQTPTIVDPGSANIDRNIFGRGISSTSASPSRKKSYESRYIDSRSRRISSTSVTSNGSKTNIEIEETEFNEKNRRNVSAQASPRKQITTNQASQCSGHEREGYEFSSDTSNERDNERGSNVMSDESNVRVFSPEKSFDIITHSSNPSRRNSIDQLPVNILSSTTTDSTDIDKETSSDDVSSGHEVDSDDHPTHDPPSGSSVISNDSNSIDEVTREVMSSSRSSGIRAIAFDETDGPDISLAFDRHHSNEPMIDIESGPVNPINSESIAFFQSGDFGEQEEKLEAGDKAAEREDGNEDEEELVDEGKNREVKEKSKAVSIIVSSRPHSRAAAEYREVAFQPLDIRQSQETTETTTSALVFHELSSLTTNSGEHENVSITNEIVSVTKLNTNELPMDTEIRVVTVGKINRLLSGSSRESIAPDIVGIHTDANEVATPKRFQSRVPRSRMKMKTGQNKIVPVPLTSNHNGERPTGKLKSSTSQCLTQLESNDWEVTIKGLKSLSIIARQEPEQLDTCPPGTVGRLLGRHVRNLRSQVSRMACLAAGDAFETGARCIDQDLDDIVGPLLHRTADTNKFLRADSNAALDRMVEHLPPHRTIAVIVYRGASHQNAVVRATTARLLSSIVDRIGPNLAMTLPRDVREKLLGSGAKLLMDGNLDARNHAKIIFKRLSRCDGFRKALTDCVPEATLRHIDKTLRSL